jgi:hypothetical protein
VRAGAFRDHARACSATSPARISTPSEPTPLACRYESLNATVDVLGRNSTGA